MYKQHYKKEYQIFKHMFSIVYLFNSSSSYVANPTRINPIIFSIALYNQKMMLQLKKKAIFFQSLLLIIS